jgi:hypothetical protein
MDLCGALLLLGPQLAALQRVRADVVLERHELPAQQS